MKYAKILRIFGTVVIMMLLIAAVPAGTAMAVESITRSPTTAKIGDNVTVTGTGFSASTMTNEKWAVIYVAKDEAIVGENIGTDVLTYKHVADAQISFSDDPVPGQFAKTFQVPSLLDDGSVDEAVAPGTYYIYVTIAYPPPTGITPLIKAAATFTVMAGGEILLSPLQGVVGSQVEITGTEFAAGQVISIKYDGVAVAINSGSTATASNGSFISTIIVPQSTAGDHNITVTAGTSGGEAEANFTVTPEIVTMNPPSGQAGDTVAVTGTGFRGLKPIYIFFNETTPVGESFTTNKGSFSGQFTVPTGLTAGTYPVDVMDDVNTVSANFTLNVTPTTTTTVDNTAPTAAITYSVPGPYKSGASVTITATFNETMAATPAPKIGITGPYTIAATDMTMTDSTHYTYVHTIGSGDGTATVALSIGTDLAGNVITAAPTSGATFTVDNTPPTTTPPTTEPTLENIVITGSTNTIGSLAGIVGTNFAPDESVTIKWDNDIVDTITTDASGVFQFLFYLPETRYGDHTITATDETGNEAEITYTVTSEPHNAPSLLGPLADATVKSPATFDWADVTDFTVPVTYTLQIANNINFSTGTILLEKPGINLPTYTLTEAEELALANQTILYWRVRAVDSASNSSPWTTASQFYLAGATSFPNWALYTLIGIGAVLIFFIGYWLGRRTAFYY